MVHLHVLLRVYLLMYFSYTYINIDDLRTYIATLEVAETRIAHVISGVIQIFFLCDLAAPTAVLT